MRISRVSITNFRSIKDLTVNVPQIFALVGPNNSGKSNLLEAIHRVIGRDWVSKASFTDDDVFGRNPESDITIKVSFEPALKYKKFAFGEEVDISTLSFEYTRY